jgi:murein DD-endopeptidase MepM/ murein hydrolase activator NlpD
MTPPLPKPPSVKLLSKTLPSARAGRIRIAWFVLGTGFGVGCSMALSPLELPRFSSMQLPEVASISSILGPSSAPADQAQMEAEQAVAAAAPEVPELAPVVAEVAEPVTYPHTKELVVASGDNFVGLLGKAGVGTQEAHRILDAMGKKFNPRSLGVKDKVSITVDKAASADTIIVNNLSIGISSISTLSVNRNDKGGYDVSQVDVPVEKKLARAGGPIDSSLYETIVKSGMPSSMVGEIIKAYSYDVDFQREIHQGDTVDVVFEKNVTSEGKAVGYGNIIYAALDLGDRELKIYRYTDKSGNSDYYNLKGESVRKALLRTPINGARISSGFGMRNHPILGYSKMHKGVDFAAATGTPVYAAGDGTVSFVGRKGGYGNYLQIKHNGQYASAYAHLSRFASGMASGKKVKQGQIVAYVGSTGASTGPHLHYEILSAGAQVNPANVKFKTGTVLAGNELKSFKKGIDTLQAELNKLGKPSGKLAMLDDDIKIDQLLN